ncbi:tyrosine-protein phosphatase non-receptor type 7-like isoform X2 [Corticium candelabrum]|uniref:tyrosine-protein phosphatase non-receptor type 7-like isoform X2 n=1 Tax=Corticium candelabrum TaxID=121492 RepID=UPI002E26648F|nr:tyrosine-protein phosphatase non-receptor type 7-like isoform X2 [Corticium candelabrum]
MAEVGAYGLAVWAIVLIGFGFAFVTTIFVVIVSTVMRRMLIRSRRPLTFTVYPAVPRSPSKLHPSHARDSVILNDAALQRDTATMQEQNGPNGHAIESKREGDQKEDGDTVHMHTFENAYTTQTTTSRAAFTSAPTVENAGGRMSLDSSASEPPPPPRPRPPFSDATVAGSDFEYRMRYEPIAESAAAVVVESPSSDTQQSFLPSGAQRDSVKKRKKRTDSSGTSPQSRPLSRGSMAEMAANDQELDEEFKGLPTVKVDSKMLPPDAYVKNRYSSVLPAPDSLVPVHNEGTGSVYINANFVRGYEGKMKAYIATQAPMENTVDDFWSMVMEHNVSVIIMVTYLYEYGVEKCIQYWPERGTTRYGDTEIANLEEVHKEHYVRTTLKLRHITLDIVWVEEVCEDCETLCFHCLARARHASLVCSHQVFSARHQYRV